MCSKEIRKGNASNISRPLGFSGFQASLQPYPDSCIRPPCIAFRRSSAPPSLSNAMAPSSVACSALNCPVLSLYPTAILSSSGPNCRSLISSAPSTSFCKGFRQNCPSKCRSFKRRAFQTQVLVRAGVDVFVLDFDGVIDSKEGKIPSSIAEALSTTKNPFYIVAENKEAASKLLKEEAKVSDDSRQSVAAFFVNFSWTRADML